MIKPTVDRAEVIDCSRSFGEAHASCDRVTEREVCDHNNDRREMLALG